MRSVGAGGEVFRGPQVIQHLGCDIPQRADLVFGEQVDEVTPHRLHVWRHRRLDGPHPVLGENHERAATIRGDIFP